MRARVLQPLHDPRALSSIAAVAARVAIPIAATRIASAAADGPSASVAACDDGVRLWDRRALFTLPLY